MLSALSEMDSSDAPSSSAPLRRLAHSCRFNDCSDLEHRLTELACLIDDDMRCFVQQWHRQLPSDDSLVQRSAHHLLANAGKHLRPICVLLAARCGEAKQEDIIKLGLAAELVHNATLLHDDVVDVGSTRRGQPTSRTLFGNVASIFAGDWVLVRALQIVHETRIALLMPALLTTLDHMIAAESLQLEQRGKVEMTVQRYFDVVEGKTASLFRWAMLAGAQAAQLDQSQQDALCAAGEHMGIAFQLVDDVLDYQDQAQVSKTWMADLREGKTTYPLLVALERNPELIQLVRKHLNSDEDSARQDKSLLETLHQGVMATGALDATRVKAGEHAEQAIQSLSALPPTPAQEALCTIVRALVSREQ